MIRAWSPVVPHGWSTSAEIAVDQAGRGAVFRGLALATLPDGRARIYATDFHNARVVVFDEHWRLVVRRGAFVDRAIPAWYAPFGIQAAGLERLRQLRVARARERKRLADGRLRRRVRSRRQVARPRRDAWGRWTSRGEWPSSPEGFGPRAGSLVVANFGSGRVDVFERRDDRWSFRGVLRHERRQAGRASRRLGNRVRERR